MQASGDSDDSFTQGSFSIFHGVCSCGIHIFQAVVFVFRVAPGWRALVGVTGYLSCWVVSQRYTGSLLVIWLDLWSFSLPFQIFLCWFDMQFTL